MAEASTIKPVIIKNIPEELKLLNQWVAWRAKDTGTGKITKVPINPLTGLNASSSNPETWASFFEDALSFYGQDNDSSGIGFMFTKDDPFCGVDLDNCRNPETGEMQDWASEILNGVNS